MPLARILVDEGVVGPQTLVGALAEAGHVKRPLASVIAAEGLVSAEALLRAQADHFGVFVLRRAASPPQDRALKSLPAAFCLEHAILPWMYVGETLVIATAQPERFDAVREALPETIGAVMMAVTLEQDIHDTIAERHGAALAEQAERARSDSESCRDLDLTGSLGGLAVVSAAALAFLLLLAIAPNKLFLGAFVIAFGSLLIAQTMKLGALLSVIWQRNPVPDPVPATLPKISLLVPLFNEEEIATALVARLARLRYPKTLTEILLVLESDDSKTRAALDKANLPAWFRVIAVPPGTVKTKPRALNYALNFASGDIIGIYDAEDAPAIDQLDRVAARFAAGGPRLGCLQGILDFYNPRANWLSRCFAIEYASWFRVMLPGLARLGFVVPLGGTTVFIRRAALEAACGWDAHNVTEDADLGIVLARRGYRTELIRTVTLEEANNRLWPWVRQRSRWLKGYAITWWVHARRPRTLLADLGPFRTLGIHALFFVTVLQMLLAPVLWSFWLVVFGLPHPLDGILPPPFWAWLVAVFLSAEAITILVGIVAIAKSPHGRLLPWVPTLVAYFPLGTIALYKGLWEILRRPFYWDKTQHGRSAPDVPGGDHPIEADRTA